MTKPKYSIIGGAGLRDGLHTVATPVPTTVKLRLVEMLLAAVTKRVLVASFLDPEIVPQMADAGELFRQLPLRDEVVYSALGLNVKGVQRAVDYRFGTWPFPSLSVIPTAQKCQYESDGSINRFCINGAIGTGQWHYRTGRYPVCFWLPL